MKLKHDGKITISLEIHHALRIPHNKIIVRLERANKKIQLCAFTQHLDQSWKDPEYYYKKDLSEKQYAEFLHLLSSIRWEYLRKKESDIIGLDGSTWTLAYNCGKNKKKISVWSPDYNTEQRDLHDFQRTVNFLLDAARIDNKTSTPIIQKNND